MNREYFKYIPYLVFICYVLIINKLTLHLGFAAHLDEGYLYTLGQRVLDGQAPYIDFYFLRTPLSIYFHAFGIWLFGQHYSILVARILLVIQMSTLVLLLSTIYRQYVNILELTFLLCFSYTITTLLLPFPWYSYDGLFFAGIAIFFLYHRKYFMSGVMICLAGFAKQNYFLLLPGLIGIFFITGKIFKNSFSLKKHECKRIIFGFLSSLLLIILYFLITGNFLQFIDQVFFLPKTMSNIDTSFIIWQDNPKALLQALPYILITVLIYYYKHSRAIFLITIMLLLLLTFKTLYSSNLFYIYSLLFINYTGFILLLINRKKETVHTIYPLLPFYCLFCFLQYLSGFNYGGLYFAYMGAGLALPFIFISLKNNQKNYMVTILFLISLFLVGIQQKKNFHYHDADTASLTEQFNIPLLDGIKSTPKQTSIISRLYSIIINETSPDDYVFFYSDYPALYYLTGRKNPTKIDWYYKREVNQRLLREAVTLLNNNPPELIIENATFPKLTDFINAHYRKLDQIEYLTIYQKKPDSLSNEVE